MDGIFPRTLVLHPLALHESVARFSANHWELSLVCGEFFFYQSFVADLIFSMAKARGELR